MSPVPPTVTLPGSCRSLPVCPRDANAARAAAPTAALSSTACPLLPRRLHPLPLHTVGPAGLGHRNQDKGCCPRTALSTVGHICETDLSKGDVFQPLPSSRPRLCPASPSTSWNPDPNPSLLHHCQTLPELLSPSRLLCK